MIILNRLVDWKFYFSCAIYVHTHSGNQFLYQFSNWDDTKCINFLQLYFKDMKSNDIT